MANFVVRTNKQIPISSHFLFLFLNLFFFPFFPHLSIASSIDQSSPFTAKASLIRYWNSHVSNQLPKPDFLFSKSSPLSAVDAAVLATSALSSRFESFCSSANLFCSFDSESEISVVDADFKVYENRNFVKYGAARLGGADSFKNYSGGLNSAEHSFKRYSDKSNNRREGFSNYAEESNEATSNFASYATGSTGGSGEFVNYDKLVTQTNLGFTAYDLNARTHNLLFTSYGNGVVVGSQSFTRYAEHGNSIPHKFTSYANGINDLRSTFTGYAESGKSGSDSFEAYGVSGITPHTNFKGYGNGGNSQIDTFSNYRKGATEGDDSFQSYARNSNSGSVNFLNYGKSFSPGSDKFKGYGRGSINKTTVGFKSYTVDRSFLSYVQKGVSFSEYNNSTTIMGSGIHVNKYVEWGKFFRESELKEGNIMVMLKKYILTILTLKK